MTIVKREEKKKRSSLIDGRVLEDILCIWFSPQFSAAEGSESRLESAELQPRVSLL